MTTPTPAIKRLTALLITLALCLTLLPTSALAEVTTAPAENANPFTITEDNNSAEVTTDYTWADGVLTIKASGLTVANTDLNTPATARINVADNLANATLTLAGVNIDASTLTTASQALNANSDLTITLKNNTTNTLIGPNRNTQTWGISSTGNLTITGSGTLKATGGTITSGSGASSCGIESGGTITIEGGNITANGGTASGTNCSSYGIRAYKNGNGGQPINITGGKVTATGGSASSSSYGISGGNITISDGTVTATGGTATNQSYGIQCMGSTFSITGGSGTAKTTATSATTKQAMDKVPTFAATVGSKQAHTEQTMSWGTLPAINTQPGNASVTVGETANFTVAAQNGTLTYQWQSSTGTDSTWADVTGATSASYTTGATTVAMSGTQYRCVVSNDYGDVESSAATLTVTAPTTYTVTFNSQGGSAVESKTVNTGEKITAPTAPTKSGFTFGGWFKEAACTNAWDFATDTVTGNITLYAKWTEDSTSNTPVTGVTVTPATANLTVGDTQQLTATVAPDNATNKAVTWSSSNDAVATVSSTGLVTAVSAGTATITVTTEDGSKTATCAVTVAAKPVTTYTVTFDSNGGSYVAPQTVEAGKTATEPADPTMRGWRFRGWYLGGELYDFSTPVTSDITLTAKWSGGNSGGGNGGGNDSDTGNSGNGNSGVTEKNPDGSTTTTTEKKDGTVIEETKRPDGSTTVIETKPDGTVTTTDKDKEGNKTEVVEKPDGSSTTTIEKVDGTITITVVEPDGTVISQVELTKKALEGKETVEIPMPELPSSTDRETAPVVTLAVPKGVSVKVEVPVENPTPGTVAIIVHEDGREEIIKSSIATDNGVALTIQGSTTVKIVDNSKDFLDVAPTSWAADSVDFVTARELFGGVSQTDFAPNTAMTRQMLMTVLARLDGVDTTADPYGLGMTWAVGKNISDGSNPTRTITREELAVMLWRYAGGPMLMDYEGLDQFSDVADLSLWAQQAMVWAHAEGIIGGTTDTTLDPQGQATRAQVATMIQRYCENAQ